MTQFGVRVTSLDSIPTPPDWEMASASGVSFAIAAVDAMYEANMAGIRDAGILPGAYVSPGISVPDFVSAIIDPVDMLIVLDTRRENGPEAADSWMAEWREQFPTHPVIQFGGSYASSARSTRASNGPLMLWGQHMRRLYPAPAGSSFADTYDALGGDGTYEWTKQHAGWPGPAIWEFSEVVTVPGFHVVLPALAFRGTIASLRALTDDGPHNGT